MKSFILFKFVLSGLISCQNAVFASESKNIEITLLVSNDSEHMAINHIFKEKAIEMGYHHIRELTLSNSLFHTLRASHMYKNIINLKLPYPRSSKALMQVITNFNKSDLICIKNCDTLSYWPSENSTTKITNYILPNEEYTTMISSELIVNNDLLAIVENPYVPFGLDVLICLPCTNLDDYVKLKSELEQQSLENKYISVTIKENCDDSIENYDAIIRTKPNERNSKEDSDQATVFYQTPYNYPEYKDNFPNSINLTPSWQSLKYAIVKVLKYADWYRVALVSDDSEYSEAFSADLIPLIQSEDKFAFTAQVCEGRSCNFKPVLRKLSEAHARIIILNIDKKNANNLVSAVKEVGMPHVTWLVRDWPFDQYRDLSSSYLYYYEVYSFNQYHVYQHYPSETVPFLSTLSEGLMIIENVYREAKIDKREFRRKFSNLSSKLQSHSLKTIVRVTHFKIRQPTTTYNIRVTGTKAKLLSFTPRGETPKDLTECLFRSYDFFAPCQLSTVILLMGVVIMFALLQLVILVFFNHYRSTLRYHRLQ